MVVEEAVEGKVRKQNSRTVLRALGVDCEPAISGAHNPPSPYLATLWAEVGQGATVCLLLMPYDATEELWAEEVGFVDHHLLLVVKSPSRSEGAKTGNPKRVCALYTRRFP